MEAAQQAKLWRALRVVATMATMAAASSAGAKCTTGDTLYAYDYTNDRVVTVTLDGNATVGVHTTLSGGIKFEGMAMNGSIPHMVAENGAMYSIDVATGNASLLNNGWPAAGELVYSLAHHHGSHFAAGVYHSATNETYLDDSVICFGGCSPTGLLTPGLPLPGLTIGGMDTYDCSYEGYLGTARGQTGTIQVFNWTEHSPGVWGLAQFNPIPLPGEEIGGVALESAFALIVATHSGKIYRVLTVELSTMFATVTPQYLGQVSGGFEIRALSFSTASAGQPTNTPTPTPTPAVPVVQSKQQQACINAINRRTLGVLKTRNANVERCLRDASRGKVTDYPACALGDPKGRIQKAIAKSTADDAKRCAGNIPNFAYAGANDATAAAEAAAMSLLDALFGSNLAAVPVASSDKLGSRCQQRVHKAANDLLEKIFAAFNKCKKATLKNGAGQAQDLHACLSLADKSVVNAQAKVRKTVQRFCPGLFSASIFPGVCSGLSGTPLEDCIVDLAACPACVVVDQSDDLGIDCDLFDDATANASCPAF